MSRKIGRPYSMMMVGIVKEIGHEKDMFSKRIAPPPMIPTNKKTNPKR